MAKMREIICSCGCKRKKLVRVVDIKRGWGKFYSKSCKAKNQERKTGQYKEFLQRSEGFYREECGPASMDSGVFGHGQE
ncbi:MAG: hypothetical protein ACE5R3_05410 [Nitrosopumilaceae archaeon]